MNIRYSGVDGLGSHRGADSASHGCDLNVSITVTDGAMPTLTCVTEPTTKDGARLPTVTEERTLIFYGGVNIETNGGDGARGLKGVDGAPGVNGRNGADATTYCRGEDGGNGGPGGDGTPGTSGGPGGDGGDVTLNVSEDDIDALALFTMSMEGGQGGPPGRHGQGGRGGRGGKGGNSHSWREPYQEMVTKTRQVSRYENGQTVYHTETYYDYETRYREHYQPGGADGRNGPDGYTPTTPLHYGDRGADGQLTVRVETEAGVQNYPSIYSLKLEGFTTEAFSRNGIFEPGDSVEVTGIRVRNSGGMPTPPGARLCLEIARNKWSRPEPLWLGVHDAIQPGQSVVLPGRLLFRIDEYAGDQNEPYRSFEPLDLNAIAARFVFRIPSFTNEQRVLVSHPIETTEAKYVGSLLADEVTRLTLRVKNVSRLPIGGECLEERLRRTIKVNIERQVGSVEESPILFCAADGTLVHDPVFEQEIGLIDSNKTVDVTTFVRLMQTNEERRAHTLQGRLLLEKLGTIEDLKRIQTNIIEIKEGIPYRQDPEAGLLLVINQTTTQEEVRGWRSMAESLNLGVCVWDLGVHHHLPLNELLESSDATLNSQWENKLIVVLNHGGGAHETLAPNAFDQISQPDLDRAIREHNIRFYVVGSRYRSEAQPSISPFPIESAPTKHSGVWALRSAISKTKRGNVELTATIDRIRSKNPSLTREEFLAVQKRKIREYLSAKYPSERFYISSSVGAEEAKKYWGIPLFKERVGEIMVRREEGPRDGILVGAQVDADTMRRERFICSDANKVLTLAAMPDEQLVRLLGEMLTQGSQNVRSIDIMCRAFAYKIAVEIGIARDHDEEWGLSESSCLNLLVDRVQATNSRDRKPILSLCALLMSKTVCLSEVASPWHQKVLWWGRDCRVARSITREVTKFDRHLSKILSRDEMRFYKEDLRENLRSLRRSSGSMKVKEYLEHLLGSCPDDQTDTRLAPWSVNPYFSDSSANQSDLRIRHRQVESEISRRIRSRETLLAPSCARR